MTANHGRGPGPRPRPRRGQRRPRGVQGEGGPLRRGERPGGGGSPGRGAQLQTGESSSPLRGTRSHH